MSFEISIGGEEVPEIKRQIDSNNILMDNWNNCKHRSDKTEYTVKTCCSGFEQHVGYQCFKLDIKDLTPQICSRCNHCDKFLKDEKCIKESEIESI